MLHLHGTADSFIKASSVTRTRLAHQITARLVIEFEVDTKGGANHQTPFTGHHEAQKSFQTSYLKDIKVLVTTMEELGNPILEDSHDLIALDTKDIPEHEAVSMLEQIEAIGQEQSQTFISECLI